MFRVILLWLVCGFIFSGVALAQKTGLPEARFPKRATLSKQMTYLRQRYSVITIGAGYENTAFLNPVFQTHIDEGRLGRKFSYYIPGRIVVYPVSLDAAFFISRFSNVGLPGWNLPDSTVQHRGWELALSVFPLPYGKIARVLAPYAGVGYQFSQLCNTCIQQDEYDDAETPLYAVKTSLPVWKAGVLLHLGAVYLEGEYKQSMSLSDRYAVRVWKIGLGFLIPYKS